jgi:ribosomal protein L11
MLQDIMKAELEKQEGITVEVKEEGSNDGESRPAFLDMIVETKEEEVKEEIKEEVVTEKKEEDVINKDSGDSGIDTFDFSNEVASKTEDKKEEVVSFDINEKFKELYPDLGVEDVAQLISEYKELKERKPLLADSDLEKVAGLLVDGEIDWNKIKQIADIKTMDVSKLDDRTVFVNGLKGEGYSDDDITEELEIFDATFGFDEELADSREILDNKRLKSSLKKKLKEYRDNISKLKDDAQFDLPKINLKPDTKSNEEELEKQREMVAKWNNVVKSNVSDFKEVVFSLDKDKKYNFKVAEEDVEFLEKSITDSAELYKRYQDKENNTFDFKSMRQDLFMMKNWKTVVKTLIQQNANNKAEEVIKDISNISFDGSQRGGGEKVKSPIDLGINKLLGL